MSNELLQHPYAQTIWGLLMKEFGNEYGVAALMGNLQAESGLYPDRVQGDIPYSDYSKTYTANVDSGAISEYDFVHNGPNGGGYGLAQWTYYTRKQRLYNLWKHEGYPSIGSVDLACTLLITELRDSYPNIYSTLKSCDNIRTASDMVLHDFENPADQSESVEELRESLGKAIYSAFTGTGGSSTTKKPRRLSKLLLYSIAIDDF